jgi:cephalosporin hydroxylase
MESPSNSNQHHHATVEADYLIPDYLVQDLRRTLLKVAANEGWYQQTWLGVPVWQLPEDLQLLQRVVSDLRPGLIVETGTKFGGSALFFSSMLQLLELPASRVLSIDIHETEEARRLLPSHPLSRDRVTRLVGSSLAPEVLSAVDAAVRQLAGVAPVLVFLDDWHGGEHVLAELRAYSPWVGSDGLLIVADTSFADLAGTPVAPYRALLQSNPRAAIEAFLAEGAPFRRSDRFPVKGLSNFADGLLERPS